MTNPVNFLLLRGKFVNRLVNQLLRPAEIDSLLSIMAVFSELHAITTRCLLLVSKLPDNVEAMITINAIKIGAKFIDFRQFMSIQPYL